MISFSSSNLFMIPRILMCAIDRPIFLLDLNVTDLFVVGGSGDVLLISGEQPDEGSRLLAIVSFSLRVGKLHLE